MYISYNVPTGRIIQVSQITWKGESLSIMMASIAVANTNKRRPVVLVFQQQFTDVNQAIAFEKQIKGWSRKKKEAIIRNEWHKLPELAKNRQLRNDTSTPL